MGKKILKVLPGQIWLDNDVRSAVDEFTVLSVTPDGMYATVQRGPRKSRIRCDRMLTQQDGRGYTYIGKKR